MSKVRELGFALAEYIAKRPFNEAAEIIAELYDLVNERRDHHIEEAHKLIDRIIKEPEFPNMRLCYFVDSLNTSIKQMEGSI